MESAAVLPHTIQQIERLARERLDKNALSYYSSGANAMDTLIQNEEAYNEIKLKGHAEVPNLN